MPGHHVFRTGVFIYTSGMLDISVIGTGRVGGALVLALADSASPVTAVVSKDPEHAAELFKGLRHPPQILSPGELASLPEGIFLIAVRDDQIRETAEQIAAVHPAEGSVFLHTSGAKDSGELEPLRIKGASVGSLHPLVSISEPAIGSSRFPGTYFCVEGDSDAVEIAKELVSTLEGTSFTVPTDKKALYHASAVMACGHLVALVDAAARALAHCGPSQSEALQILLPLVESTVANLEQQTPAEALTGPFARADVGTLLSHLSAFDGEVSEDIRETYLLLGRLSLDIAGEQGADPERLEKIRSIILQLEQEGS